MIIRYNALLRITYNTLAQKETAERFF